MKRYLLLYLPLVGLILALTAFLGVKLSDAELTRIEAGEAAQLRAVVRLVAQDLERPIEQLQGLAQEPALQRALSAAPQVATASVQDALQSLLFRNPRYAQARWLGADGMERVRIDRVGEVPRVVVAGALQNKSDRPYYTNAMPMAPGQVYLSALDLNVEHGKVEVPYRPMVRVALRLPTVDGRDLGLLVINVQAQHLFDEALSSAPVTQGEQFMLLNPQAFWLLAPDPQDAWGHLLGHNNTLSRRQPQAWASIAAAPSGRLLDDSGLWVWDSIEPGTLWPGRLQAAESWKVVSHLSTGVLWQLRWQQWQPLLLGASVILLLLSFGVQRYRKVLETHEVAEAELAGSRALKESQAQLKLALQAGRLGTFHHNLLNDQISFSDQFAAIFGWPPGTVFTFEQAMASFHPDDRQRVKDANAEAFARRQGYSLDYRVVWPDASLRWVNMTVELTFSEAGRATSLDGVVIDITRRKERELELQRTLDLLSMAERAAGAAAWDWDMVSDRLHWTEQVFRIFGLDPTSATASFESWRSAVHPEDLPAAEAAIAESVRLGQAFEASYRVVLPDGTIRWIEAFGQVQHDAAGMPKHFSGLCLDATARKQTEQALRDSQRRLKELNADLERTVNERTAEIRLLAENASDVVFRSNQQGVPEWISPSVTALVGWRPEDMLGKPFEEFVHPDDLPAVQTSLQGLLRGERSTFEVRIRTRDAGFHWVSVRASAIRNSAGAVQALVGGWRDIQSEVVVKKLLLKSKEHLQQALDDMTASEARFHTIFEQSPIGIAVIDSHSGHIFECNTMFAAIAGRSIEEMRSTDWMRITHPDDIQPDLDNMARLNAGDIPGFQMNKRYLKPDGSVVWISMTVAPIRVAAGEAARHLAMVEDITQRIQAEEALAETAAHLREAQQIAHLGSWTWEITTGAATWSDEHYRNLGYPPGTVTPSYAAFLSAVAAPDRSRVETLVAATLESRRAADFECKIRQPDGTERDVQIQVQLECDSLDQPLRLMGISLDITQQKQAARALMAAKEAAEQASRAKSAFVANMSHEVRTPMNAVLGFLDLLGDTGLDARQRTLVEKVQKSSRALLRILNDILDFSKLDAAAVHLETEPFALDEVLHDATELFALAASSKGLTLDLDVPPDLPLHYRGDALRLGQILNNLLGNAIKFTEQGSVRIAVRALADEGPPGRLRFEVTDTGIGVTPEQTARLFQPFTQADDSTTRRFGGTGLGLAIVKHLVELMGGEIGVQSALGQGASFWFTLPLAPDLQAEPTLPGTRAAAAVPVRRTESIRGAHVLLVEDNATNQEVALAMLGKMGLRVTVANNGREALQKLAENNCALVLMDLHMPVMDGFETTAAIRATAWGRTLPIIALTAAAFADDRQRVLDAGMNDFVSKPVESKQLLSVLLRWLPQGAQANPVDPFPAPTLAAEAGAPASAAAAVTLPTHLDGFDLAQTLSRLGHDEALLLRVLRQFRHDFKPDDWAAQFNAARSDQQQARAQGLVHTLKGAAANVGAVRLQAAAAALELALQVQEGTDPARLQQCLDDCLAALRAAATVLQTGLPGARRATTTAQPEAALQDLAEVEALLRRHRLVPAALLARLREHVGQHAVMPQLEALLEHIGDFDFENALRTLKTMQENLTP